VPDGEVGEAARRGGCDPDRLRSGVGAAKSESRRRRTSPSRSRRACSKPSLAVAFGRLAYRDLQMAWPKRLKIGARAFWLAFAYSVRRAPASVGVGVE
jgi:hypothetical protein